MRMLGEMATANPSTGSFADYARDALGGWAGFSVGWLYWYYWVIVVGFEAVAGAKVFNYWVQCAVVAGLADPDADDDRDQLVLRVVLRGIRILVRRNQSRDHHDLPRSRHAVRPGAMARSAPGFFQPHRSRRVLPERRWRHLRRGRRGDLLHGRRGGRDHRRRRNPRSRARNRERRPTRWPLASRSSLWARCSCSLCSCRGTRWRSVRRHLLRR